MPKIISWRKLVQNFRKLGFEGPYSGGKHLFMKKGSLKVHIPSKHRGDISAGLVNEILRQAPEQQRREKKKIYFLRPGIRKEDWDRL